MPNGNSEQDEFDQYKRKPEEDEFAQYKAKPANLPGAGVELTKAVQTGKTKPQPETQFEKERPGKGISLEGAWPAAKETLKSYVPPDPTGGHSPFEKEFWIGDKPITFDPAHGGIAEAGREIKAGWERGHHPLARLGEAATSGIASLLPFPVSGRREAEHAARGEGGAIIGETATPALATVATAGITEGTSRIGEAIKPALERRSLAKAAKEMRTAAPPTRSEIDYNEAAKGAAPFLAEEQRSQPIPKGKEAVRGSFEAANSAVQKIEAKTAEYAASFPDETLSRQEILDRVREKLSDPHSPRTPREIEAGVSAAAEFVPRDLSLAEADRLRWRMNRDTASEMGMTEADRADVRASNPKFAAKEELGNALRDGFYGRLEEKGVSGVRELREGEGDVLQMRDAFRRNVNRAENPNPPSAMRRIGIWGPVGLGFLADTVAHRIGLPPGVATGLGFGTGALYEYLRRRYTPGPMMERAFGRLGRSSLRPEYPEVPPQSAETIGTPIEPSGPTEPPRGQPGGVNPSLPPAPEAGVTMREQHGPLFQQGIGGPIERRSQAGVSPTGLERRGIGEMLAPAEESARLRAYYESRAEGAPPEERAALERAKAETTPELVASEGGGGERMAEGIREARAAEGPMPILPEEEPVETEVKGITAKESKAKAKRESIPSPEKLYSADEITDAEGLLNQESGAMLAGDRPGAYFDESEAGDVRLRSRGAQTKGGDWRGVRSGREMHPFMREHPDWSPAAIQKALRNKDSALYKRAVSAAAEFIRHEAEAERAAIQEEGNASIAGEPIFPGMGRAVAETARGAAELKGEELSRRMNEPRSIETAAGEMETKSPLFRGTAASPQNEMFGQPIEPAPKERLVARAEELARQGKTPQQIGAILAQEFGPLR